VLRSSCATAPALILLGATLACGGAPAAGEVVVYTAHDLLFSEPILKDFERQHGVRVRLVGDTEAAKTTGLVNRLIQMRDRPEADVFWNNEVMNAVRLSRMGLVEPYVPATAADIPARHRDPAGHWVGFGARARVLLYNTNLVPADQAPRSIFDLCKPALRGRITVANPLFGTAATHAAALFATLGEERARQFFLALRDNGCRVAAGNALARNLVADGELAACLTDTDDANEALMAGKPVAMVYPDQDGLGALVIPNTVLLIRGGPHPDQGRKLVDHLASREVEARLARMDSAQMPLRPGIPAPGRHFDLEAIKTMAVDWNAVADAWPASTRFLQETFIR
jgi:iron(III) transport system substrate-binding protein